MNMNRLLLALILSTIAATGIHPTALAATSLDQAGGSGGDNSGKCPLRAAELDKLTPYRWQFSRYQGEHVYTPTIGIGGIRIESCQLLGKDAKGAIRAVVVVNYARGANVAAFAKYWRAVCADSLMPDARGKVQPVSGVTGVYRCVTASGRASNSWLEAPALTIQLETMDSAGEDVVEVEKVLPQLLAAAASSGR
jgi:hypothetical protein